MADEKRADYQRELKERCEAFLAANPDNVGTQDLYEFVRAEALTSFKNGKSAGVAPAKRKQREA